MNLREKKVTFRGWIKYVSGREKNVALNTLIPACFPSLLSKMPSDREEMGSAPSGMRQGRRMPEKIDIWSTRLICDQVSSLCRCSDAHTQRNTHIHNKHRQNIFILINNNVISIAQYCRRPSFKVHIFFYTAPAFTVNPPLYLLSTKGRFLYLCRAPSAGSSPSHGESLLNHLHIHVWRPFETHCKEKPTVLSFSKVLWDFQMRWCYQQYSKKILRL